MTSTFFEYGQYVLALDISQGALFRMHSSSGDECSGFLSKMSSGISSTPSTSSVLIDKAYSMTFQVRERFPAIHIPSAQTSPRTRTFAAAGREHRHDASGSALPAVECLPFCSHNLGTCRGMTRKRKKRSARYFPLATAALEIGISGSDDPCVHTDVFPGRRHVLSVVPAARAEVWPASRG